MCVWEGGGGRGGGGRETDQETERQGDRDKACEIIIGNKALSNEFKHQLLYFMCVRAGDVVSWLKISACRQNISIPQV